jgi:hypothetical protein
MIVSNYARDLMMMMMMIMMMMVEVSGIHHKLKFLDLDYHLQFSYEKSIVIERTIRISRIELSTVLTAISNAKKRSAT